MAKEVLIYIITKRINWKDGGSLLSASHIADRSAYDKVKAAILTAFQLIPEAYSQRFRSIKNLTI